MYTVSRHIFRMPGNKEVFFILNQFYTIIKE